MNLSLFCALFIFQYVAHKLGDYPLQSDWQAQNKSKNIWARFQHCLIYSLIISLFTIPLIPLKLSCLVFAITIIEHMFIDSRKPIVWWKTFFEEKIMRNKSFDITALPFFVLIEIDQSVHILRILLISLLISYLV